MHEWSKVYPFGSLTISYSYTLCNTICIPIDVPAYSSCDVLLTTYLDLMLSPK